MTSPSSEVTLGESLYISSSIATPCGTNPPLPLRVAPSSKSEERSMESLLYPPAIAKKYKKEDFCSFLYHSILAIKYIKISLFVIRVVTRDRCSVSIRGLDYTRQLVPLVRTRRNLGKKRKLSRF